MARRLVRDQAALIAVALLALAACSKRGCACLAKYSPERSVAELDPLALELYPAGSASEYGRVSFALGHVGDDELCPTLSESATLTWNDVAGTFRTRGGTTTNKAFDPLCQPANVSLQGPKLTPVTKVVLADDKGRVEMTLPVGEARLATPSVRAAGESTRLVVEIAGLDGKVAEATVSVANEADTVEHPTLPQDTAIEGNRITVAVPTKVLTGRAQRVEVGGKLEPNATCVPARKVCKAKVSFEAQLKVTVER